MRQVFKTFTADVELFCVWRLPIQEGRTMETIFFDHLAGTVRFNVHRSLIRQVPLVTDFQSNIINTRKTT